MTGPDPIQSFNKVLIIIAMDRSKSVDHFKQSILHCCVKLNPGNRADAGQWVYKCSKGSRHPLSSWPPGSPILVVAAEYGRADFVDLLVNEFGCEVNVIARKSQNDVRRGRSALHLAVHYGHKDTVQRLLALGANPNIVDSQYLKPVHLIIKGIQSRPKYLGELNRNGFQNGHCLEPQWIDILRMLIEKSPETQSKFDFGCLDDLNLEFFEHEKWKQIVNLLSPETAVSRSESSDIDLRPSPLHNLELGLQSDPRGQQASGSRHALIGLYQETKMLDWAKRFVTECQNAVAKAKEKANRQVSDAEDDCKRKLTQKEREIKCLSQDVDLLTRQRKDITNSKLEGKDLVRCDVDSAACVSVETDKSHAGNQAVYFGECREQHNHYLSVSSEMCKTHVEKISMEWMECSKIKKARDNLNSSLHALSIELYASEMHFLDELIQNAIDSDATVIRVYLTDSGLCFSNNGTPFTMEGVTSICSIGQSCKRDRGDSIGHKGLGFKSVFKASDRPFIRSGEWSFGFEIGVDLIQSFLIPRWIEPTNFFGKHPWFDKIEEMAISCGMVTRIYLPFSDMANLLDADKIQQHILDVLKEGLSLNFWNKVQKMGIWNEFKGTEDTFSMTRTVETAHQLPSNEGDLMGNRSILKHTVSRTTVSHIGTPLFGPISTNFFLVVGEGTIDPSTIQTYQYSSDTSKKRTKIAICFPLQKSDKRPPDVYPLFAYMPIHSNGGFSFLLHADWLVVSSRESIVESEIGQNRFLRDASAELIAAAFVHFLADGRTEAGDKACLRFHMEHLLNMTPPSLWWLKFKKNVIEQMLAKHPVFRIFTADLKQQKEIEKVISNLSWHCEKLNIIVVNEMNSLLPELSIYDIIRHADDAFFTGRSPHWWAEFFSGLLKFVEGDRFVKEQKEFMEQIIWSVPMFQFFKKQSEGRKRLCHRELYLLRPDGKFFFPCECLPGVRLLEFESPHEKALLLSLGMKIADDKQIVRLILLHHISLSKREWYDKYGGRAHTNRLGLHFLYEKRAALHLEWKNILSAENGLCNFRQSLLQFSCLCELNENDFELPVINEELLVAEMHHPRLWILGGKSEAAMSILPAQEATLGSFMTVKLDDASSHHTYVYSGINQHKDASTAASFDLFLLEIGCMLPALSSIEQVQIHQDEVGLQHCLSVFLHSIKQLQDANQLSALELSCIPSSDSNTQQIVFQLVVLLKTLSARDADIYMQCICQFQRDLEMKHSRRCHGTQFSGKKEVVMSCKMRLYCFTRYSDCQFPLLTKNSCLKEFLLQEAIQKQNVDENSALTAHTNSTSTSPQTKVCALLIMLTQILTEIDNAGARPLLAEPRNRGARRASCISLAQSAGNRLHWSKTLLCKVDQPGR